MLQLGGLDTHFGGPRGARPRPKAWVGSGWSIKVCIKPIQMKRKRVTGQMVSCLLEAKAFGAFQWMSISLRRLAA